MTTLAVPELTLRRLPRYYHFLKRLAEAGHEVVSASQIAEALGVHPTQVRKDLALTGAVGKPKVGHTIETALASIEKFLHWNSSSEAFLVGAGHLGSALLGYRGFERAGIKVVAAFDVSIAKVGRRVHGVPVIHMNKFEDLARRMHVALGILTVPEGHAQEVADLMIRSGLAAIWNFSSVSLRVPEGVIVENVELFQNLAVFSRRLAERA